MVIFVSGLNPKNNFRYLVKDERYVPLCVLFIIINLHLQNGDEFEIWNQTYLIGHIHFDSVTSSGANRAAILARFLHIFLIFLIDFGLNTFRANKLVHIFLYMKLSMLYNLRLKFHYE